MNDIPATPQATVSPVTPPLFIEDGWTIKATIKPEPGIHPGLAFHYRPMTWIERRKLAREQEKEPDQEKQDRIRARQMAERIIDWGASTENPTATPTAEQVCQLEPLIFGKLEAILFGVGRADTIEVERKN